jgi:outer membrane protein OmpA-like peptidoglycan-associated protein
VSELKARQTERGWVLTLTNDLLFDTGKATLKPGGKRAVEKLAQFMREHPDRDISIEGFTDSSGPDDVNRSLSERRAEAVKQALVARGVETNRIDARGYGQAFPVASNDTPAGRQLNRRVEIIINPS